MIDFHGQYAIGPEKFWWIDRPVPDAPQKSIVYGYTLKDVYYKSNGDPVIRSEESGHVEILLNEYLGALPTRPTLAEVLEFLSNRP